MKHLKTFEGKNLLYDVGDYVYVEGYLSLVNNFARIYRANKFVKAYGHWDYLVNFFDEDGYISDIYGMHIDEDDIERKMTPEEIEDFESKISASKYNL